MRTASNPGWRFGRAACLALGLLQLASWSAVQSSGRDGLAAQKKEQKKNAEPYRIRKLTQGIGLGGLGPVSPDGQSILLMGQKPGFAPNLYLMDLGDFSIRPPLTSLRWGVQDPAWSPAGDLVALAGSDDTASFPEIYVLDLATRSLRRITRNNFTDKQPVFTPDGKRLLYTSDESPLPDAAFGVLHVATVPAGGGKPDFFTEDECSSVEPAIQADGKSILLVKIDEDSGRHSLWQYGLDGKPRRSLTGRKFARIHRYIQHGPAGLIVLWAQEEAEQQEEIYLLDLKTGEARSLPEPDLPKHAPAISSDGKRIAFVAPGDKGFHLFLYDIGSGEIQQLTRQGSHVITPVFISDSRILFGSDRDTGNEIYLLDLSAPIPERKTSKQ